MARKAARKEESTLLKALKFVSVAQSDGAIEPYRSHCRFVNNYVVAFDGVIAAGAPIAAEVNICPHTFRLINALERATGNYSLTALDSFEVSIKTDKFRALVPGLAEDAIQFVAPDWNMYPMNDSFKKAAKAALTFTTEGATAVAYSAALTCDHSLIGTNGNVFVEAYHGIATPPGLIIPKAFFDAIQKVAEPIVGFGLGFNSDNAITSITVWFADQTWIKTQLYLNEKFPNIETVVRWTEQAVGESVPKGLFDAVSAVAPFNDGAVYLVTEGVQSHESDKQGATHVVKNLAPSGRYAAKHLLALAPYVSTVDFTTNDRVAVFFGKIDEVNIRGCIAKSS